MTQKNSESLARSSFKASYGPTPGHYRKRRSDYKTKGPRYCKISGVLIASPTSGRRASAGKKSVATRSKTDQSTQSDQSTGGPKPKPILAMLGSSIKTLGLVAAVGLYLDYGDSDWRQLHVDEVRMWQAESRERFAKKCVEILGDTAPADFERYVDTWLREQAYPEPRSFAGSSTE
jgi:hypothetical protein